MRLFWISLSCTALVSGFAVGATQQLPAPKLDANALLAPTIVIADAD
ncbi:MAG: hypothetical protein AAFO70_03140 [Pseudomonadota bacterium]